MSDNAPSAELALSKIQKKKRLIFSAIAITLILTYQAALITITSLIPRYYTIYPILSLAPSLVALLAGPLSTRTTIKSYIITILSSAAITSTFLFINDTSVHTLLYYKTLFFITATSTLFSLPTFLKSNSMKIEKIVSDIKFQEESGNHYYKNQYSISSEFTVDQIRGFLVASRLITPLAVSLLTAYAFALTFQDIIKTDYFSTKTLAIIVVLPALASTGLSVISIQREQSLTGAVLVGTLSIWAITTTFLIMMFHKNIITTSDGLIDYGITAGGALATILFAALKYYARINREALELDLKSALLNVTIQNPKIPAQAGLKHHA